MRKTVVALVIVFSILLSACSFGEEGDMYPEYYIDSVGVVVNGDNPYDLWNMAWPYYYGTSDDRTEMNGVSKDLSNKDKNYIISYIESLQHEKQPDKECLCVLSVTLIETNGHG